MSSEDTSCDIYIFGNIPTVEAWEAICEAIDSDLSQEEGTAHEALKTAIERGAGSAHLEETDIRTLAEDIQATAVKHGLSVVARIGSDWNSGGVTFYVKDGVASETIAYIEQDSDPVLNQKQLIDARDKGLTLDDLIAEMKLFHGKGFSKLSASEDLLNEVEARLNGEDELSL